MKTFFHLFAVIAIGLLFQSMAVSQISITTGDLPNYFGVGNSLFIYGSSDTVTMNVGTASSSTAQTWTAPSVNINDSLRTDNVLPSSSPYYAYFPQAAYAQKFVLSDSSITIDAYQYYRVSNDSISRMGLAEHESGSIGSQTIDTTIISYSNDLYFPLPVQLGENFNVKSDTLYEQGNFKEVTTSETTVDAYGTLNLPIGSFGALRSSSVTSTNIYEGATLLYGSSTYSISWLTKEGHQLSVAVDTLSSGNVMVHSVTLTYSRPTPTFVKTSPEQPRSFALDQNYPNPFNPTTTINYQLPMDSHVTLKVFDILGREVSTLVNEKENAGSYSVKFDGSRHASGVYFYRIVAGSYVSTKKLVLMK